MFYQDDVKPHSAEEEEGTGSGVARLQCHEEDPVLLDTLRHQNLLLTWSPPHQVLVPVFPDLRLR